MATSLRGVGQCDETDMKKDDDSEKVPIKSCADGPQVVNSSKLSEAWTPEKESEFDQRTFERMVELGVTKHEWAQAFCGTDDETLNAGQR
jgi:hypothetical protein